MKKLLIAAAAVAVTGGAFAAPLVYDYKASVKHMYLKQKTIKAYDKVTYEVYLKYQKSASLKGYLVMDHDGTTSATVTGGPCDSTDGGVTSFDYGRNRGFLVVQNNSASKNFRTPKIIPAVLDAKYMDSKYTSATMASSGIAEGYLFLGGDSIACVRPQLDLLAAGVTSRGAAPALPTAAAEPGMTAYADYVWTSVYLFDQFNGPNWYDRAYANPPVPSGPFDAFETAWDNNLPPGLRIGFAYFHPYFHDTWMNGSGFGKYTTPSKTVGKLCCGLKKTTTSTIILDTLSGSVKGGLFLCTENLIDAEDQNYMFFDDDMHRWEDQFYTIRDPGSPDFAGDRWQNDLWQDGAVEQETTDVIAGNWSIKYNAKFYADGGLYEKYSALPTATQLAAWGLTAWVDAGLAGSLAAAARALNTKAVFIDGSELHAIDEARFISVVNGQEILPVVTPQFVLYYGIAQ